MNVKCLSCSVDLFEVKFKVFVPATCSSLTLFWLYTRCLMTLRSCWTCEAWTDIIRLSLCSSCDICWMCAVKAHSNMWRFCSGYKTFHKLLLSSETPSAGPTVQCIHSDFALLMFSITQANCSRPRCKNTVTAGNAWKLLALMRIMYLKYLYH